MRIPSLAAPRVATAAQISIRRLRALASRRGTTTRRNGGHETPAEPVAESEWPVAASLGRAAARRIPVARVSLAGHSRPVPEDEAKAVVAVAAQCLTWSGWRRWEPVMRYGRLFTPGTDAVSDRSKAIQPMHAGREAYRMAVDSGLLYAEGYATYLRRGGVPSTPWAWAWCLDGDTVLAPPAIIQGTAFFGVALRPQYMRGVHAAQRGDDGSEGFLWAFTRGDREIPPLDPAADITLDLGRDIPPSVREWALTAERHPGPARRPPDWVVTELLGAGPRPVVEDPYRGNGSGHVRSAMTRFTACSPPPQTSTRYQARRLQGRTRGTWSAGLTGSTPGWHCSAAARPAAPSVTTGKSWA